MIPVARRESGARDAQRRWRPALSGLDVAAIILLLALSLSVTPGLIGEDTKNDLYVDPWAFLGRALHFWDPQVTWGVVANQGYGYLFPMGPFFGIVGSLLPMWVAQRLWWALLLVAGYLGMRVLLHALSSTAASSVAARRASVLASLAYAVSPRIVSTIGGLSAETLPVVMAPWILAPLVLAHHGRLTPRKAAAATGLAVLCCGGVNGAAVFCAVLPAALWTVTRHRWWRSALSWWTLLAVGLATAWWVGPLLLMGRYAPPFLDWIETAAVVTDPVGMLDVARGTTHWLARLYTPAGPWWPAGFDVATSWPLVLATTAVAALAVLGLALPRLPHRRYLWLTMGVGLLFLVVPHTGPLDSPVAVWAQGLLDGALAPLRNVHKADPLIRLPLTIALAHALTSLATSATSRPAWRVRAVWLTATVLVVSLAAPGFARGINVRGPFEQMAPHWQQAGQWLDEHRTDGPALIVPAANFGEYQWGRTIDEPLRPLTSAPFAVRDSVPLTPAGTVRFLDDVEQRLQSGRSIGSAVDALRAAGTRYLVLRNDLDAYGAGQPPVTFARSALLDTPGVTRAAGFGRSFQDDSRERVQPVEVYDLGSAAPLAQVWSSADVTGASGAPEALSDLRGAGVTGPVLFDGDATATLVPGHRVETDGYRARERFFGATRGRDASASLDAERDMTVRDYRPWQQGELRSVRIPTAGVTVIASTSLADEHGLLGLWPAMSADAAVDGDPTTAWVTAFAARPTLRLSFDRPHEVPGVDVTPLVDRELFGRGQGVPTRVQVRTEHEAVEGVLEGDDSPTRLAAPSGPTRWLEVTILDTDRGDAREVVTGLAEVSVPGIDLGSSIELATPPPFTPATGSPSEAVILTTGPVAPDGCVVGRQGVCLANQLRVPEERRIDRTLPSTVTGSFAAQGTLIVDARTPPAALTSPPGLTLATSSVSTPAFRGGWFALADEDASTIWRPAFGDREPTITMTLDQPQEISSLSLRATRPWPTERPVVAVVSIDAGTQRLDVPADGRLTLTPTPGREVVIRLTQPIGEDPARRVEPVLHGLRLNDRALAQPSSRHELPCGQGPMLQVDGRTVPTAVTLERDLLTGASAQWRACAPIDLAGGARVVVTPLEGTLVGTTVLRPTASPGLGGAAQARDARARWEGPTALTATIDAEDADRVLVTTVNANPGWRLSMGEQTLTPVTIDGFKQSFVVPAGVHGTARMEFTPDRAYRGALLGGGLAALLLVVGAVRVLRQPTGRAMPPRAATSRTPRWLVPVGVVAVGGLITGWPGLLVAFVACVVVAAMARVPGRRSGEAPVGVRWAVLPAALVLLAGVAQAVVAPSGPGPTWLEATTRLLLVGAAALAVLIGGRSDRSAPSDTVSDAVSDDPIAPSAA